MERVSMGAIGGFLFGEDQVAKKKFRQSMVGQRNREILVSLSSQVYAYIASVIGSTPNLDEFVFRIWIRFEVFRRSGEIVRTPEFSVEVFKFVGSFGGTTPPAQRFTLSVAFIGTPNNPYITNFFKTKMSEIKKEFTFMKFTSYEDFLSAPKDIQRSLEQNKPYLVVDEQVFEIATEIDAATNNPMSYCMLRNGKHSRKFALTDKEKIAQFILLQTEPEPELHRANVSIQRVDGQLKTIESRLQDSVTKARPNELDVAYIEQIFLGIVEKVEKVKPGKLKRFSARLFPEVKNRLLESRDRFQRLKIDYVAAKDQLDHVEKEMRKATTSEQYLLFRSRAVKERLELEGKIIELQSDLFQNIIPKLEEFTGRVRMKGTRGKRL
jgi:hypothetical protein